MVASFTPLKDVKCFLLSNTILRVMILSEAWEAAEISKPPEPVSRQTQMWSWRCLWRFHGPLMICIIRFWENLQTRLPSHTCGYSQGGAEFIIFKVRILCFLVGVDIKPQWGGGFTTLSWVSFASPLRPGHCASARGLGDVEVWLYCFFCPKPRWAAI